MNRGKFNSRGQVTIFVILALVLVGAVVLYFVLTAEERGPSQVAVIAEENPEAFMQLCLEENLSRTIKLIEDQGGFVNPLNYHMYDDKKVAYLCKTLNHYEPCVNQHPMFLTEVRNEIKSVMEKKIEECFIEMEATYEEAAMDVELTGNTITEVELAPNRIFVTINKDIKITQNEDVSTYKKLDIGMRTGLYSLVHVASRIAHNEALYCYFERGGYMNLHPEYEILMHGMSDGTKIYSIKNLNTQEELNIGIMGCLL